MAGQILKKLGLALVIFGILYAGICGLIFSQQRRFIFVPSRVLAETPETLGLSFESVLIPVTKSQKIHAWWIPATTSPRGTLLYLHGNGLNMSANVALAKQYQAQGLSVLMIDYRGYGLSDGDFPQEAWVYADADAALSYLRDQRQVKLSSLIVFGHSLGGAIAIDLAQKHPEVAGLIVQSSFTSMERLAKLQGWPNLFPLGLILTQRFDSLSKVPQLTMPKLWIHGDADELIPARMSQQLHAISSSPSTIQVIEGAGHNNAATIAGDRYNTMVQKFLDQALAP
jgi:uncharacterized protein